MTAGDSHLASASPGGAAGRGRGPVAVLRSFGFDASLLYDLPAAGGKKTKNRTDREFMRCRNPRR
jgi:hypothetical protein